MAEDIRWIQRLDSFSLVFAEPREAVDLARPLGVILVLIAIGIRVYRGSISAGG